MLDPAPAQVLTSAILRNVDLLTPNQSEAAAILGSDSLEIRDFHQAEEAAKRLLELGPATVVLKLGPLGCLVAADGVRAAVPAFRVVARDTTAAGDVFNGALAVALAEGRPVFEAAVFANAAAAISVTRPGAQASIPGRDEVEEFLQRNAILVR
jgi:ribokinase